MEIRVGWQGETAGSTVYMINNTCTCFIKLRIHVHDRMKNTKLSQNNILLVIGLKLCKTCLIAEHRIFMEVAFAYQDKFKFAVATDAAVAVELGFVFVY